MWYIDNNYWRYGLDIWTDLFNQRACAPQIFISMNSLRERWKKKKMEKKDSVKLNQLFSITEMAKAITALKPNEKKHSKKLVTITAAHHPSAESNKYRACFWGGLTVNYGQDGRAYNLLSNWVHLAYLWLNRHPVGPWIHWEELWFWRRLSLAIYGFIKGL